MQCGLNGIDILGQNGSGEFHNSLIPDQLAWDAEIFENELREKLEDNKITSININQYIFVYLYNECDIFVFLS